MVTIAVRVSPPPAEDGATISPTSASFRSTVPVERRAHARVLERRLGELACARPAFACATLTSTLGLRALEIGVGHEILRPQRLGALQVALAWTCCASSWATFAFAAERRLVVRALQPRDHLVRPDAASPR
jgi:hypothetical protein